MRDIRFITEGRRVEQEHSGSHSAATGPGLGFHPPSGPAEVMGNA